jgi:hypothetical protein
MTHFGEQTGKAGEGQRECFQPSLIQSTEQTSTILQGHGFLNSKEGKPGLSSHGADIQIGEGK